MDPYSNNEVFQKELQKVAWASFAGHATFSVALMPIGGTAGLAVKSVNAGGTSLAALRDLGPADLRLRNLKILLAMGLNRELANAFLNNPNLSPTSQTIITDSLNQLGVISGRGDFINLAAHVGDGTAALRYQSGARLLATINRAYPIIAIGAYHQVPLAMTSDGTVVAPLLEWDYAFWTPTGRHFIELLKGCKINGHPARSVGIYLTGQASTHTLEGARASSISLTEKALPGPLR